MDKNRLIKTVAAYILLFIANATYGLFYVPYLLKNLGSGAFAYYPLSVAVINFASVIAVIMTSMLSAFLIKDYNSGNDRKVNEFINSALSGNLFLVAAAMVPLVLFAFTSHKVLNVPDSLKTDVKILFLLVSAAFFVAQIKNSFMAIAVASGNKYLTNSQKAFEKGLTVFSCVILFTLFSPSLILAGCSLLLSAIIRFFITVRSAKRIFPGLSLSKKHVKKDISKRLFVSGAGNSLTQLIFMLSINSGAVLSNLLFGPGVQSAYSLGGQLPYLLGILLIYLMNSFIFFFAVLFKKSDYENLKKDTLCMQKVISAVIGVAASLMCIFGDCFLKIWISYHYQKSMYVIMILYSVSFMINGSFYAIYSTIVIAGRVKLPAAFMLISEIVSVALTVTTAIYTKNIYSVAFLHLVTGFFQFAVFMPLYFSKKTNTDSRFIYKATCTGIISFGMTAAVSVIIKFLFYPDGFLKLLAVSALSAAISLLFIRMFFVKKEDIGVIGRIIKANTEYRNGLNELQGSDYDSLL